MLTNRLHSARGKIDAALVWLEAHPAWLAALTLFLGIRLVATGALIRPLWHDELFTFYIAQADSFHKMIQQTRTVDLNPPLYYMAVRFVFHFLHPSNLSVRLPSAIAFLLAAYFLFLFVGRRLGPIYGVFAGMVLLGSFYQNYAFEARPYAFVLCFLALTMVGWQRATDSDDASRIGALTLVVLGGTGLLLSHVLALVAYAGFFLAELVRFLIRRKPDWPTWLALTVPLSCVWLFIPLIQNHGAGVYPDKFQASIDLLLFDYSDVLLGIAPLFALAAIVVVFLHAQKPDLPSANSKWSSLSLPEEVLAVYFSLVPLFITLVFMRSHSPYFSRYGIASIIGIAVLVPWFFAHWTKRNRVAGLICCFVFLFGLYSPAVFLRLARKLTGHSSIAASSYATTGASPVPLPDMRPELPLVDASGLTFLEMDHQASNEFARRLYYLTDTRSAVQYAHATIFESFGELKRQFPIRANVEPYAQFIQQHQTFLVYGTFDFPEDWLLRKLLADGAELKYLGKFPEGYRDEDLYEVTIK
jgi:hypothetical protein